MSVDRRHILGAALLGSAVLGAGGAVAAPDDEAKVTAALEAFRQAMLNADRKQFEALIANQVTYGHSSGRVQTKKEFIDEATSGKSVWKSITLSDTIVKLAGANAMTRCVFTGESQSEGKTNAVKIGVLMVWVKQNGKWRLLARQGYKN